MERQRYAVIFAYSFDNDVAVYLFDGEEKAREFLRSNYQEEIRIERDENGFAVDGVIDSDGWFAEITYHHGGKTYMKIGKVYS